MMGSTLNGEWAWDSISPSPSVPSLSTPSFPLSGMNKSVLGGGALLVSEEMVNGGKKIQYT